MPTAILAPELRQRFFDADGAPLDGGFLYTYAAGSAGATNKATYKDANEVAANTNPIVLDDAGYCSMWLTDDGGYYFVLKDSAGNTLWDVDNVPGGPYTSLKTVFDGIQTQITNLSTAALNYDPQLLNSVPTTVQKKLQERKTVRDFWNAADADFTNAFTKAVTYINNSGGNCAVSIPFGAYTLSGAIGAIKVDEGGFIGDGFGAVVNVTYDGAMFVWGDKGVSGVPYGGGFENCQIKYPSAPGANAVLFQQNGADGQNFRNLRPQNFRVFLQCGPKDQSSYGNAAVVEGVKGWAYNGGSPCFDLWKGAGLFTTNCQIYLSGVPNPANNRTSTMVSAANSSYIRFNSGATYDTVTIGSNCSIERWWRVIDMQHNGGPFVWINVFVDPTCFMDYISNDCIHIETTAGGGGVSGCKFHGHMNSWSGRTIAIVGNGACTDINIFQIKQDFSGKEGILIDNVNCSKIRVWAGTQLVASDRLDVGNIGAFAFRNGDDIQVHGIEAGRDGTLGGAPWGPDIGMEITAVDYGKINIQGCEAFGAVQLWKVADNTTLSSNRMIKNNYNVDYAGKKTGTGVYTDPGINTPWLNKTPFTVKCYAYGPGVFSLQHSGTTVVTIIGQTCAAEVTIEPGESFSYTGTADAGNHIEFFVVP